MADIKEYISYKKYDSLAWVPTIRGALSLEIVEDAKYIFGDVDKYIVPIKSYKGLKSQYHIAATALLTFNDSKSGPDYCRTFRYIFCGQINPKEHHVLKGRLCILAEDKEDLSKNEADLLDYFIDLTRLKKEYDDLAKIDAASMEDLAKKRSYMIIVWKSIIKRMDIIEKDECNPRVNFCFNTVLFRDGLLLLKYDRNSKYTSYIFERGGGKYDESDFTENLPIHRVFKVAMNIIKFLFHSNYHHNADHDTFLPASNLHPLMNAKTDSERKTCFTSIFHHQLDSLLTPITKLKRKNYDEYTVNPRGVFLYANSLINVFCKNQLITKEEEIQAFKFLEAQRQEYEIMTEKQRAKRNAYISLANPWAFGKDVLTIMGVLLSGVACLWQINKDLGITLLFICAALVGFLLFLLSLRFIFQPFWLPKEFIIRKEKHPFFFRNSNLRKGEFSFNYKLWIKIQEWKLTLKVIYYYLKSFFIAAILFIILGILYNLDWKEIIQTLYSIILE